MNTTRVLLIGVIFLGLAASGPLLPTGANAQADCDPIEDRSLCIEAVELSEESLVLGEQGEFTVTVRNTGETVTSGTVVLHTASPENETESYEVETVSIDPGQEASVSRAINASTVGTHGLRFTVLDAETREPADVSDVHTIEVLESHPAELGGPIDRTELALVAFLGAILSLVGLGYRMVQS
ncbi:hypothetical protein RH831_06600 [Halodesulfurarchaeum sp. HSR-GB]|uniref:hypothetical protein n=1 Tax=Halodesulfurarchaeum sp. HSR-GB TaxID=3074077 RepID=UPI00285B908B|nr:hypothetical protein [Halodesulfurarchaeum sp. HSR-GB]MDR5656847.1 hypothetical protein [Halodesulfurarchaeum sp. HSR-GB]